MGYVLGIDLGTTYTAAAVMRDGRASVVDLGNRQASVPSVVFLREDETILTGESANRRGLTEPDRVARQFKRRVGDTTPMLLGGAPISVHALTAKLLRWVIDTVSEREGGPPDAVAVSHPANWGQFKVDVLHQAVRMVDLGSATLLTEPEAAAIHYASQERVEPGSVIAVYDLGGGTFDAAVLRKADSGFEVMGEPEGIERLGGIDFDAAVFAHVQRALAGKLDELDPDDPAAQAAVSRLRDDCVEAKEALSSDTDVSIPVLLPNVQTEVRLTRAEFEAMIRPSLADSIDAMRRALRSAGVEPDEVSVVLLVGGSSRVPLVAQLLSADLGRPVALDVHPKHAVALGAAIAAAGGDDAVVVDTEGPTSTKGGGPGAGVLGGAVAGAAAGAVVGGATSAAAAQPTTSTPGSQADLPTVSVPADSVAPAATPDPSAAARAAAETGAMPPAGGAAGAAPGFPEGDVSTPGAPGAPGIPGTHAPGTPGAGTPGGPPPAEPPPGSPGDGGSGNRTPMIIAAVVAAVVLIVAAVVVLGGGDDGDEVVAGSDTTAEESDSTRPDSTDPATTDPDPTGTDDTTDATPAPPETSPPETMPAPDCDRTYQVCITDARWEGDDLVADFETDIELSLNPVATHAHFYLAEATTAETSGTQADPSIRGSWRIWASKPTFSAANRAPEDNPAFTRGEVGGNTLLCATVANSDHATDPLTEHCIGLPA